MYTPSGPRQQPPGRGMSYQWSHHHGWVFIYAPDLIAYARPLLGTAGGDWEVTVHPGPGACRWRVAGRETAIARLEEQFGPATFEEAAT